MNTQLRSMVETLLKVRDSNHNVNDKVSEIDDLSGQVTKQMTEAQEFSLKLSNSTEKVLGDSSRFKIGEGQFEENLEKQRVFRDRMQAILKDKADQGINIFDQNYQPIPNTNPQKYKTVYDSTLENEFWDIYDEILAEIKGAVSLGGVDVNGYAPTHIRKQSVHTGNPEIDLVSSRHKRKFDDPIGLRAARNTESFLTQTYVQAQTGRILTDLSMPIYVNNKHWGCLRVNCDPMMLLEGSDSAQI
jgi:methyl-accepting chemotaxis protein